MFRISEYKFSFFLHTHARRYSILVYLHDGNKTWACIYKVLDRALYKIFFLFLMKTYLFLPRPDLENGIYKKYQKNRATFSQPFLKEAIWSSKKSNLLILSSKETHIMHYIIHWYENYFPLLLLFFGTNYSELSVYSILYSSSFLKKNTLSMKLLIKKYKRQDWKISTFYFNNFILSSYLYTLIWIKKLKMSTLTTSTQYDLLVSYKSQRIIKNSQKRNRFAPLSLNYL